MLGSFIRGAACRGSRLAVVALPTYLLLIRPAVRRWGATEEEARRPMPGDELVPEPTGTTIMATTIDAPATAVWPWLVQMGCGRAGWYSWDRLDNAGVPSAAQVLPEHQHLHVGDRIPLLPGGGRCFTVTAVEPRLYVVLRHTGDLLARPVEPGSERARSDVTWTFLLDERPDGTTRLLVRTREGARSWLTRVLDLLLGEPAHFIMQHRQLVNLKRRAEVPLLSPAEEVWAGA